MRHLFFAFTNPVAGAESRYNAWYDASHVPEVLRYGRGFVGCRRYRLSGVQRAGALPPWQYLALYDIESDDLSVLAERAWIDDKPPLTPFRGLLEDDHVAWVYTPAFAAAASVPSLQDTTASSLRLSWWRDEVGTTAVARTFRLADAQRLKQQVSPWPLLQMEASDGTASPVPPSCDAAWVFAAVSGYVENHARGEAG